MNNAVMDKFLTKDIVLNNKVLKFGHKAIIVLRQTLPKHVMSADIRNYYYVWFIFAKYKISITLCYKIY